MSKKLALIDQLRKAIADSGESQNAIANAIGIDQANLNSFMLEKRGMSWETADKLCQYLDLKLVKSR